MEMATLFVPRGNDVVVTARFPTISDGSGSTAELYTKPNRYVLDSDPDTMVYQADIIPDDDNPGASKSIFNVPAADTSVTGYSWWRVDAVDQFNNRRTANAGPWIVEAV
jgi:hypothetical protein